LDFGSLTAAGPPLTPETLSPLTDRLARASEKPAHPELETTFAEGDDAAVRSAIQAAGPNGPAAAKALELALASSHPEWIDACLQQAEDLPPLLRNIALSRIAWLQDRKADAIAGWPGAFPDLKQVRLREDWDGWESADFSHALEELRRCVSEELAALVVPENPTPEQRQAVIDRLSDPLTMKAVGRARFAHACLQAALALSAHAEHSEATLKLAATARQLGMPPAPCLRAEAMSLTALGDYQNARERWVKLITEHPVEEQLPGDYAEASYTSFENADPRQAMAILTTGMHRFPNDANFALRAGWVSLLTGNAERAYRFLLTGRQIGYPPGKLENATALLAIAAEQTGAAEDAAVFYQDLIRLDVDWENPETIDTLEWPEELKDSLRRLVPVSEAW
jgi:tetratricopeptide (TPR) repeat protein